MDTLDFLRSTIRDVAAECEAALLHLDEKGAAGLIDNVRHMKFCCSLIQDELFRAGFADDSHIGRVNLVDFDMVARDYVPCPPYAWIPRAPPVPTLINGVYVRPPTREELKDAANAKRAADCAQRQQLRDAARRQRDEYVGYAADVRRKILCEAAGREFVPRRDEFTTLWVERKCDTDSGMPSFARFLRNAERKKECIRLADDDIEGKAGAACALFTRDGYIQWVRKCTRDAKIHERYVSKRLAEMVGGRTEVGIHGNVLRMDIVTNEGQIIEVKRYVFRYGAVDQVRRYGIFMPGSSLRIHLFDCYGRTDDDFNEYCRRLNIVVTYDSDEPIVGVGPREE